MLYCAWHFLLLLESDELSLQPFANTKVFDIWGRKLFYSSSFIMNIFGGSCWTEPLASLMCCSPTPFLASWPEERFSYLQKYHLLCICVWEITFEPGWQKMSCVNEIFCLAASQKMNTTMVEGNWFWNLNNHLQEILFFSLSHLSLNKVSECFIGLNGTL